MDTPDDRQQPRRVIKRYSNRKLYDTRDSRYVTLLQIAEMVRGGEDVQIIDNTTKEDKTEVTLALAISEELKAKPRAVPLGTLRTLIQEQGEKILTSLRDGPIGRLIPHGEKEEAAQAAGPVTPEAKPETEPEHKERHEKRLSELVASSKQTIDQWQHAIDERIRAVIPSLSLFLDIQSEVRKLSQRVTELEQRLASIQSKEPSETRPAEPTPPDGAVSGPTNAEALATGEQSPAQPSSE